MSGENDAHLMRLDCAKNFGEVKSEIRSVKERRKEDWDELKEIKHELHKLVGNGNRGRIDDLVSEMAEMKSEMSSFKSEACGRDSLIESGLKNVSQRLDSLESKFWWVVVKVIAPIFVGTSMLNIAIQIFAKHFLGG